MLYLEMKSPHRQKLMPKIFVYVSFWVFMLSNCGHSRPQNQSTNNNEVPVKDLNPSLSNRTASFLTSISSQMSSLKGSNPTVEKNVSLVIHGSRKRRFTFLEHEPSERQTSNSQALTNEDAELETQELKQHRHVLGVRSKKKEVYLSDPSDRDSAVKDFADVPYTQSKIYRAQEDEDLANYIYFIINDFIDEKEEKDNDRIRTDDETFNNQQYKDLLLRSPSSTVEAHVNLVRKRRQKSSPLDHRRHKGDEGHRRRQRRRNRRHRHHLSTTDNGLAAAEPRTSGEKFSSRQQDGFLLKSDSPSYIITSASELKKDWCRTIPLPQKVAEKNCRTKVVMNNFCYGQCNSFFIPHPGRRGSQAAFQSCAFCKPHRLKWTNVTLHCPGQNPPRKEKRIMMVESCRCITEVLQ